MIPSHLQGCVHGLLNKHLKMQPKLAGMRAYAVQRWLYNYQLNLSNLVNDEQYLDERRQRQDALRHKEADDIGHAERVKYIQEEAIRGKKRLDQVYEAGAPAAAPESRAHRLRVRGAGGLAPSSLRQAAGTPP